MTAPTTQPPGEVEITSDNLESELARRGVHGPNYGLLPHAGPLRDDENELCPLDGHKIEFDWGELERSLGGTESAREDVMASAAIAWKAILRFCLRGNTKDPRYVKGTGIRLIALGWVIAPELFPGTPTLSALAAMCRCSPANLSPFSAEFARLFRVRSRAQCRGPGNRKRKSKDELIPDQN